MNNLSFQFLLPAMIHIMDQEPSRRGDGPIVSSKQEIINHFSLDQRHLYHDWDQFCEVTKLIISKTLGNV